jgi:hypothetical protein
MQRNECRSTLSSFMATTIFNGTMKLMVSMVNIAVAENKVVENT